jgi:hypothetical protein
LIPLGCTPPLPPLGGGGGGCEAPPEMARSSSGERTAVASVFFSGFGCGLVGLVGWVDISWLRAKVVVVLKILNRGDFLGRKRIPETLDQIRIARTSASFLLAIALARAPSSAAQPLQGQTENDTFASPFTLLAFF